MQTYIKQEDTLPDGSAYDNMCGAYCATYYLLKENKASYIGGADQGEITIAGMTDDARSFVTSIYTCDVRLGKNENNAKDDYTSSAKLKDYLIKEHGINALLYYDQDIGSRTVLEDKDVASIFKGHDIDLGNLSERKDDNFYIIALLSRNEIGAEVDANFRDAHYVLLTKKGDTLTMLDPLVANEITVQDPWAFLEGKDDNARVISGKNSFKFLRAGVYIPC